MTADVAKDMIPINLHLALRLHSMPSKKKKKKGLTQDVTLPFISNE